MSVSTLHVAIIMDGNGRWAAARGLPRGMGHREGIEAVKRTVKACLSGALSLPVSHLTLYSFSTENWRRSPEEIQELTQLLRFFLQNELNELHKQNIRLNLIGDLSRWPADIQELTQNALSKTSGNTALTLTIALSYGSRQELTAAVKNIALRAAEGRLKPHDITQETVESALQTTGLPDPDLIIRTSGEQRLSNFLLWQAAYAEFYFTETLWPDFGEAELRAAIDDFASRQRRFGAR